MLVSVLSEPNPLLILSGVTLTLGGLIVSVLCKLKLTLMLSILIEENLSVVVNVLSKPDP